MKKVKSLFALIVAASFVMASASSVFAADRDRDRDQSQDKTQDKLQDGSCQASALEPITDHIYVYHNGDDNGDKDQIKDKDQVRDC